MKNISPAVSLMILLMLCLVSAVVFTLIGQGVAYLGYDLNSVDMMQSDNVDMQKINGMKIVQFFSALGLFVVASLGYSFWVRKSLFGGLQMTFNNFSWKGVLWVLGMMVLSMVCIEGLVRWNEGLHLPEVLSGLESWMRVQEVQAAKLTKAFLMMPTFLSFVFTLIVVAVLPAIGEEMLFRGALQPIFVDWFKNHHLAIWVTGFLFSALHMQFFGFFPRMALGVIFGYLFYWSGSLWYPIVGHFINNGSVVMLAYFSGDSVDLDSSETLLPFESPFVWFVYGALGILLVGYLLRVKKYYSSISTSSGA